MSKACSLVGKTGFIGFLFLKCGPAKFVSLHLKVSVCNMYLSLYEN